MSSFPFVIIHIVVVVPVIIIAVIRVIPIIISVIRIVPIITVIVISVIVIPVSAPVIHAIFYDIPAALLVIVLLRHL